MAKATMTIEGRIFEVSARRDFLGAMIKYRIFEVVHPERKIFRTRCMDAGKFWIDDFPTITAGLKYHLSLAFAKDLRNQSRQKKFEDFKKNA